MTSGKDNSDDDLGLKSKVKLQFENQSDDDSDLPALEARDPENANADSSDVDSSDLEQMIGRVVATGDGV